ncbi:putative Chromodomain-helicase-Dna-binding protein 3, partial [Cardiosporidium cionae]
MPVNTTLTNAKTHPRKTVHAADNASPTAISTHGSLLSPITSPKNSSSLAPRISPKNTSSLAPLTSPNNSSSLAPRISPKNSSSVTPISFKNSDTSVSTYGTENIDFHSRDFIPYTDKPTFIHGQYLYDYQLEGINWIRYSWHRRTSVILADEMGLGKTIQLITFLATLWNDLAVQGPFLVIAPLATLEDVWVQEFKKWAPFMNVVCYSANPVSRELCRFYDFFYNLPKPYSKEKVKNINQHFRQAAQYQFDQPFPRPRLAKYVQGRYPKFDVLLTSYEVFRRDCLHLSQLHWQCIVVDEGHRLKNWSSELKRVLSTLTAEHRILLTGTPLQNNIDELYSLLNFLHPEKFVSTEKCDFNIMGEEDNFIEALKAKLQPHILRRTKND